MKQTLFVSEHKFCCGELLSQSLIVGSFCVPWSLCSCPIGVAEHGCDDAPTQRKAILSKHPRKPKAVLVVGIFSAVCGSLHTGNIPSVEPMVGTAVVGISAE